MELYGKHSYFIDLAAWIATVSFNPRGPAYRACHVMKYVVFCTNCVKTSSSVCRQKTTQVFE